MKTAPILAAALLSLSAHAEIYKCEQGGKKVFTDRPCGSDAQKVNVRPASGATANTDETASAESRAYVEKVNRNSKKSELDSEIDRTERKIRRLNDERDDKLDQLKREKQRANNNLAGATWENSLSQEMVATANTYATKIASEEAKLKELRTQRAALN